MRQLFLWAFLLLLLPACAATDPSKDVERTWDGAYVRIPGLLPVAKEFRDRQIAELPPGTKFPTLIYMHGAGGLWRGTYKDLAIARKAGLAVIALDSFARARPQNPDANLSNPCGGPCAWIQREIVALREAELSHALKRVRALSWVDQDNLFGWGHSEGVYAMARYPGAAFKALILTGNDCYRGFAVQKPTLVVMARHDPYHGGKVDTCRTAAQGAENLSYLEVPGAQHNAVQTVQGKRAFVAFIRRHLSARE